MGVFPVFGERQLSYIEDNIFFMPWERISKDQIIKLVAARISAGLQRQFELRADFERLTELLNEKAINPFDRGVFDFLDELNECSEHFKKGGHWKIGDQSKNRYFYRIENLDSFLGKHKAYFHSGFDAPEKIIISSKPVDNAQVFENIIRNYIKNAGWQPLSRLVTQFFNYRGFSWWTNEYEFNDKLFPSFFDGQHLTMENKWLLRFAFNVGISSDWLSENMLFLRLDSQQLHQDDIRIPSIIDALLQPIFSPRAYDQEHRWGLAFDLNGGFRPLYREYVVRNIPATAIDYFPVRINLNTIDHVNANARLTDSLVNQLINNI